MSHVFGVFYLFFGCNALPHYLPFYINFFGIIRKIFSFLPVISQPCSEFRFITCWLLLWLFYISVPKVEFLFGLVVFPYSVLGVVQQNYAILIQESITNYING